MLDGITDLFNGVREGLQSVTTRQDEIGELMRSGAAPGGQRGSISAAKAAARASGRASPTMGQGEGNACQWWADASDAGTGLEAQVASMHAMLQTQQQQQERLTAAVAGLAAQIEVVVLGAKSKRPHSRHPRRSDVYDSERRHRPRRSPEETSELMEA